MGYEIISLIENRMDNNQLILFSFSSKMARFYLSDVPVGISYDEATKIISINFKNGMNMELDLNMDGVYDEFEEEYILSDNDTSITVG